MIKEQEYLNNLYEIYNDKKIENTKQKSKDSKTIIIIILY